MLTTNNISEEELFDYVLYRKDLYEINITEYHVDKLHIEQSDDKYITLNVNIKSNNPTELKTMIGGNPISMDYVIYRTFTIPRKELNIFLRRKKLNKITDGILL